MGVGVAVILLLGVSVGIITLPVVSHTQDEPYEIELIAGGGNPNSEITVGKVKVWNDNDYLYVKYETDQCWIILETHLHVADSPDGIPQTKKFNPIPGHFEYSSTELFEVGVQEKLFTIPLPEEWKSNGELFIAAHAVVVEICNPIEICAYSEAGVDVFGPKEQYYALDDPTWGISKPAVETSVHPSWPSAGDLHPDAKWISTAYYVENPVDDSWRKFHSEIELPEKGYYLTGSIVLATADNAEEVYFNDVLVGSDGEVQGPFDDDYEWSTIVGYPVEPIPGVNNLDFIVRNYYQAGGVPESNPSGLVYAACFEAYQEETAWGAGSRFNDKNWATYFNYELQFTVTFPEEGNAYIGYEDRTAGDFDYNDFGMNMFVLETYVSGYLSSIHLEFTSVVHKAGDNHDIHIFRTLTSDTEYAYTISRTALNYGTETPVGTDIPGSGDFDIILFDSSDPNVVGKTVIIDIIITTTTELYDPAPTPPRWDLDPVFAYYDPWIHDKSYGPNDWHINDMQSTSVFGDSIDVPYIITVPYTDWPAPNEGVTITNDYPNFDDYYRTQDPLYSDWYLP